MSLHSVSIVFRRSARNISKGVSFLISSILISSCLDNVFLICLGLSASCIPCATRDERIKQQPMKRSFDVVFMMISPRLGCDFDRCSILNCMVYIHHEPGGVNK